MASAQGDADLWKPGVNFVELRNRMVLEAQTKEAKWTNEWPSFVLTIAEVRRSWNAAIESSAEFGAAKKKADRPEDLTPQDAVSAVFGSPDNPELRSAGERAIDRLFSGELGRRLDELCDSAEGRRTGGAKAVFLPGDPPKGKLLALRPSEVAGPCSDFQRLSRARVALAVRRGDAAEAARAIRQALWVARIASFDPNLASGLSSARAPWQVIQPLLEAPRLNTGMAESALRALQAAPRSDWRMAVRGERLACFQAMDAAYQDAAADATLAPRQEQFDFVDGIFDAVARLLDADRAPAIDAAQRATRLWTRIETDKPFQTRFAVGIGILPDTRAGLWVIPVYRMCDEGGQASLGVLAFKDAHGRLPKSLKELVPQYIPRAPIDWAGIDHQSPELRYKVLDPTSDPANRDYIIYSVGGDGNDDGGRESVENPESTFTRGGDGHRDYVVSRRLPPPSVLPPPAPAPR